MGGREGGRERGGGGGGGGRRGRETERQRETEKDRPIVAIQLSTHRDIVCANRHALYQRKMRKANRQSPSAPAGARPEQESPRTRTMKTLNMSSAIGGARSKASPKNSPIQASRRIAAAAAAGRAAPGSTSGSSQEPRRRSLRTGLGTRQRKAEIDTAITKMREMMPSSRRSLNAHRKQQRQFQEGLLRQQQEMERQAVLERRRARGRGGQGRGGQRQRQRQRQRVQGRERGGGQGGVGAGPSSGGRGGTAPAPALAGDLMSQFQMEQRLQMMYSARKDLVTTQDTHDAAALAEAVRETGRRRSRLR